MEDLRNDDCFAYQKDINGHVKCYCLSDIYCKTGKCRFYKPRSEVNIAEIEDDILRYSSRNNTKKEV